MLTSLLGSGILMPSKLVKLTGGYEMTKEELLAQSREENRGKPDERELQIYEKAGRIGGVVGGVLSVLVAVFSRIVGIPILGLCAWSIYFSIYGSMNLYTFVKTKDKYKLIQSVAGLLFGAACLVGMIVLGLKG